jgi:sugar phosphate isomerase/epimerase
MANIKYSRRNFLKLAGMGTAALTLPGFDFFSNLKYEAKIGLQLYTIRKAIENDFDNAVRKVADIGYLGIETYALPENVTLEHAAKVFNQVGLKIFSMHSELPVGADRDKALRMADAYKCNTIVYHGWPEGDKYKNEDNLKHTAEVYDEIADFLKSKGLKFGLHNHWWEFEKNDDGIYPAYYLLKHLNKDIFFEIDTYWAKVAGQDPVKILKDFGKRAPFLHIKDGPAVKGEKGYNQVPVGDGSMNFPAIVKAGGDNIKWMIVEFDEYDKNIFDGVKKSYFYLTKNHLAKGKV